jgi:hypothetical protein
MEVNNFDLDSNKIGIDYDAYNPDPLLSTVSTFN